MRTILAPAIRMRRTGFRCRRSLLRRGSGRWRALATSRASPRCSCRAGVRRAAGEIFRNPALATYAGFVGASGSRMRYYKGPIAEAIVEFSELQWRVLYSGGLLFSHLHLGGAHLHRLPGVDGVGAAAERAGAGGVAASEHPRELRPRGHGARLGGLLARAWWRRRSSPSRTVRAGMRTLRFRRHPLLSCCRKEYARSRASLIDMDHAALTDPPGDLAALNRTETTYLCAADV